ncbi:MAG: DUF2807 domain-containing protein [Bacteroidales bacterium]|nr:DUF2807 domain-containing protein [Bacteroidales bacterium]
MKKLFILTVLPLLIASCTININGGKTVKCTGPVEERTIDLTADFHAIEINGGFDLKLVDAPCALTVKANNDAFDYLEIKVKEGGTLVIETKDHVNIAAEECLFTVSSDKLRQLVVNGAVDLEYTCTKEYKEPLEIVVNGAGDMEIEKFTGPELSVNINGAADLEITELNTKNLVIEINGAGDVEVAGETDNASFTVNGAGAINATQLVTKNNPKVSTSGLASVKLN